jgi:hypothetical protein
VVLDIRVLGMPASRTQEISAGCMPASRTQAAGCMPARRTQEISAGFGTAVEEDNTDSAGTAIDKPAEGLGMFFLS